MKRLIQSILFIALCAFGNVFANNVNVTGTSYNDGTKILSFTLSWENSWSISAGPANHDAVWIFVKFQNCPALEWAHMDMSTVSGNHSTSSPALLTVDAVTDGKGVFVRRTSTGSGDIPATTININIPTGATTYNYRVFAVEMVNVPTADFEVGDASSVSTFSSISITATEEASGVTGGTLGGSSANLPAAYPVGHNEFYIMKYEASVDQYIQFLNTLTYDQQASRTDSPPDNPVGQLIMTCDYQRIEIAQSGVNNTTPAVYASDANNNGTYNEFNDGLNKACGGLNWGDITAYLDWAALRPMSDLEFEKGCRGTLSRVAGEYAWGNTTNNRRYPPGNATNNYTSTETHNGGTLVGICNYYATTAQGPWRSGYAATASTNRTTSGATYYGIMEMSGNLWEAVVSTDANGAAFTGTHGDGALDAAGDADAATWPVAGAGHGVRGGGFENRTGNVTNLRTSDRRFAQNNTTARWTDYGLRGVRNP